MLHVACMLHPVKGMNPVAVCFVDCRSTTSDLSAACNL